MRSSVVASLVSLHLLSGCADGSLSGEPSASAVLPPMGITGGGTGAAGASGSAPRSGIGGATGVSGMPGVMAPAGSGAAGGGSGMPGGAGMLASGGTSAPPMGGAGAAGAAGMPAPPGSKAPVIPLVSGECPDFRDGTITFGGLSGIQMVAGSKAAGPTAPMVFYWHGTGSFAGEYAGSATAVYQGVVAEGGVLISFQGTSGGDFLSGTAIFGASDFELTDQLLACAVQNHNVDPRRVFATGCSAGGLFSTAMAALRSSYMAAVAPNSGGWSFPSGFETDWTPALMTIHGAAGVDVVGIDFSVSSANADRDFKARGGFVINCDHGGFHCGGGGLSPDVWEFFKAHTYGVDPHPWTSLPAGFNSDCKIY